MNETDTQNVEGKHAVTLELVEEALNGENPLADKFGEYDDPAFIESMTDHVAYRTSKMDDVEEIDMAEARRVIDNLAFRGHLRRVTNDMWMDDKVTLP